MVKKYVRVYIEGGAQGKVADADFRRGWRKFLAELHATARANGYQALDIVRGKSRSNTYQRFCAHPREHPDDLCILLVDSETAVAGDVSVWNVVSEREGDKWQRPSWVSDCHLYLMVPFVETWLVTDPEALAAFFKRDFDARALPTTKLEERPKSDIEDALRRASRGCKKGPYKHGHAHEIIEIVRPDRVKTLRHGQRLFDGLDSLIKSSSK